MSLVCIENTVVAPSGTVRLLDIRKQAVTGNSDSVSWSIWPGPDLAGLADPWLDYCSWLRFLHSSDIARSKLVPFTFINLKWYEMLPGLFSCLPRLVMKKRRNPCFTDFAKLRWQSLDLEPGAIGARAWQVRIKSLRECERW